LATLLFYLGAIVEKSVQDAFGVSVPRFLVIGGLLVAGAILFGLIAGGVRAVALVEEERDRTQRDAILYAASGMDQHISERSAHLQKANALDVLRSAEWHLDNIRLMIRRLYQLLEAKFGQSMLLSERVNFEVTFMTKSYRDGFITIPVFANRSGREPVSMGKRGDNPTLYDNTYSATVYREGSTGVPQAKVVEDTADPAEKYLELYPAQRERIRSLFVMPVLSSENEVLGTIVVHCDKAHFFRDPDRRFWCDLVDIFGRRVAYEKLCLDMIVAETREAVF
jgi:GAF domain-containing protein